MQRAPAPTPTRTAGRATADSAAAPLAETPANTDPDTTAYPTGQRSGTAADASPRAAYADASTRTDGTADEDRHAKRSTEPDLEELARRLLDPLGRLLRAELRQGRERTGRLHDRRR